jgi:ElaB/YqjD/DUF883 family membrane-anchored ribosome-binding protein
MARHQQAAAEAQSTITEAKNRAAEINSQATELAVESEALLQRSNDRASEILDDARHLASGLLDQARLRADELAARTAAFSEQMIIRAKEQLANSQGDTFLVKDFIEGSSIVSSTDAVIAELEENLRRSSEAKPTETNSAE